MIQSGGHSNPFELLHELYNVEKYNPHHDDKECLQQYCIAMIDIRFSIDLNVKALGERFVFEDI